MPLRGPGKPLWLLPAVRRIIGLMSGTSADAVDAAAVEIAGEDRQIKVRLLAYAQTPFSAQEREALLRLFLPSAGAEALCRANVALAELFARSAGVVADQCGLGIGAFHAIGCHGQTVWHAPVTAPFAQLSVAGTLQIGEPAVLAARTGLPVVSNFRSADVAAGGQGAPLVPMVDLILFTDGTRARAIQNLGGMGNVTYLPPKASPSSVLAFDTGPANLLIDAVARRATAGALQCDQDGRLALAGRTDPQMLDRLMQHPFIRRAPPKSSGREEFGEILFEELWQESQRRGLSPTDLAATLTQFTVESIADAYRRFLPHVDQVVLSGGGRFNPALVRGLTGALAQAEVVAHEAMGIGADAKEALAFAVLADRTLQGLPGNLPSVTGASRSVVLGSITPPPA